MATRKQLIARCRELGCALYISREEVQVVLPHGYKCAGTEDIDEVHVKYREPFASMPIGEALAQALGEIDGGIEPMDGEWGGGCPPWIADADLVYAPDGWTNPREGR